MTKNGLRIPCMCHRCGGASKDWRTVQNHARQEAAERPLYPASLDSPSEEKVDPIDNEMQDEPQEDPPIPAVDELKEHVPDVPCEEASAEFVGHVEALPNCNEPVYETV